ncbi:uncharacterized protein LOC134714107 [Mytilus trossulus]|uniref:uncharacterized protein LOC134714107 n=1 Tax=Mytilus trossulus TaxID=6551 RepID=UPI0030047841
MMRSKAQRTFNQLFRVVVLACMLFVVFVQTENNQGETVIFRYIPYANHLFAVRKGNQGCFFYNTTIQERAQIHHPVDVYAFELKVLKMVHNYTSYFRAAPKTLYHTDPDIKVYINFCNKGTFPVWLFKGHT